VIAQVDEKFILLRVPGRKGQEKSLLVAIDQHAADERIKVEELLRELCSSPDAGDVVISSQNTGLKSRIKTTMLEKPLKFSISTQENDLFGCHASHFAAWGIIYDTGLKLNEHYLIILAVPPLIIERCTSEPKLLISLLCSELWKRVESGLHTSRLPQHTREEDEDEHAWIKRISTCPTQLLNMANSRACRSAIMFNDRLTLLECENLVKQLAECAFPFQCAHGRPSMAPLIELGDADDLGSIQEQTVGLGHFGEAEVDSEDYATAFTRWQSTEEGDKTTI
jgi:DNA mismatch repair protein MLH3